METDHVRKMLHDLFPKPVKKKPAKGEPHSGSAKVTNTLTDEVKIVKVPGATSLAKDLERGISKVPWCPERCETDVDVCCMHGWPSRCLAFVV